MLGKGPAEQPLTSATPGLVDDSAQQSPEPDRSVQRADRAEIRVAPSKTGSPSSSPSPSVKRSTSTTNTGTCKVSYYATGSTTANGESFDPDGLTAAHKTLPFNTRVRVTNRANGSSVVVRINDRGPFVEGRCLDLARGAFKSIASLSSGVISAKYEVLA
ncbi:MAG: septal ring lytic transglycosylase RlpA family protein [Micromonosporaceae bacterium]|nr:septal ring lytic transglycosylase RlpA family protein [Micromonosporaceae bacterium]